MGIIEVGAMTTLIGMGGVFGVILILALFTTLTNKVVEKFTGKKSEPAVAEAPAAAPVAAQPAVQVADGISAKTVAAIMAAIQAAAGGRELRYVAIRRSSTFATAWGNSSNMDIINSRQQYL